MAVIGMKCLQNLRGISLLNKLPLDYVAVEVYCTGTDRRGMYMYNRPI